MRQFGDGTEIGDWWNYVGLETGMQRCQKRMLGSQRQDPLLCHRALDVLVLQDHVLLQYLDGVHVTCGLLLGQYDLAEAALAEDFDEVEVFQAWDFRRVAVFLT